MPTANAILGAFSKLQANGCKPPDLWFVEDKNTRLAAQRAVAETWARLLADVDDDALDAAVVAHLGTAKAQWWPMPGALRQLAPRRQRQIAGPSAWMPTYNGLEDWERDRIQHIADVEELWTRLDGEDSNVFTLRVSERLEQLAAEAR